MPFYETTKNLVTKLRFPKSKHYTTYVDKDFICIMLTEPDFSMVHCIIAENTRQLGSKYFNNLFNTELKNKTNYQIIDILEETLISNSIYKGCCTIITKSYLYNKRNTNNKINSLFNDILPFVDKGNTSAFEYFVIDKKDILEFRNYIINNMIKSLPDYIIYYLKKSKYDFFNHTFTMNDQDIEILLSIAWKKIIFNVNESVLNIDDNGVFKFLKFNINKYK